MKKNRPYTKRVEELAGEIYDLLVEVQYLNAKDKRSFLRFCREVWQHACNGDPEEVAGRFWSLCDADVVNWLHNLAGGDGPAELAENTEADDN